MNIRIVIVLFGLLSLNFAQAQNRIFTKTGKITFDATGNLEKIQGVNKKVTCAVDKSSGAVEFAALMKAFQFEKALMEEHFNDNYVESDKFPKATFKGRITNAQAINWSKDGKYSANVEGDLTIHGVTKKIMERLSNDKRATWRSPSQARSTEKSLSDVAALVAAPILDRNGEVIGALYGDRRFGRMNNPLPSISKLDAMLVELLAHGVAVGLSRLQQEEAATIARARFEQFFTPELARQLAEKRDFLAGRNCEVTILFVDIRRFSTISERLGPEKTVAWVNDVLGAMSDAALAEEGVLVDYVGDEMVAMWGAPGEQPDHAQRACRAALAMLASLPALNQKWRESLGEPTEIGIGINTGVAFVGNTGSQRKFKYGPLGSTVNLASRVQGATKYIRSNLVITGTTKRKLTEAFNTRRLAAVRVVNMADPVDLFELVPDRLSTWLEVRRSYEFALEEFEQKRFREAMKILGNILAQHPDDGPSAVLLSRTVNMLLSDGGRFDPVWDLPGK